MSQAGEARLLAVDLGGTRLRVAVADGGGSLLARTAMATPREGGPSAVVAAVAERARSLTARLGLERGAVAVMGVAAPGPIDPSSGIVYATPNLAGWQDYPLAEALREACGLRVCAGNDATLAGLGEARAGAGRACDPLLYLTVSTGVGGAILLAGRPLDGASGLAGELGHVIVQADGPECNFGHRGCLEALSSGTAISRRAGEAVAQGRSALMAGMSSPSGQVSARQVARAALQGDAVARELLDRAAWHLGLALGGFVNAFDPRRIVLGGGVMRSWPMLSGTVHGALAQVAMCLDRRSVDVVPAALGDDAGLVGAAIHAYERLTG